ncbi:MAG: cysteine synthase family protein [Zavarzinella sp.]
MIKVAQRTLVCIPPTPLVGIVLPPDDFPVWCKLEFLNTSGSTKDRIARFILGKAYRKGILRTDSVVVEASSGSTSIAMAMACAQLGLRFLAVMPEGVSNERVLIIRAYGGQVQFTSKQGGVAESIRTAEQLAAEHGYFLPRQFSNSDNADAHRVGTAREILEQIPGGEVGIVASGVGTGGTLVGLYEGFAENGCSCVPVCARPVNMVHSMEVECCSFSSRIPGVVDSMSTIFCPTRLPGLRTLEIDDEVAICTTRELIRRGFPVGPSSGLNFEAARRAKRELGDSVGPVVTVFPDRMERYFTTELFTPFQT